MFIHSKSKDINSVVHKNSLEFDENDAGVDF